MTELVASRRGVIAGLGALLAAPVIVKAASLMRVAPTEVIRPYVPLDAGLLTLDEYAERVLAPTVSVLSKQIADQLLSNNAFLRNLDLQYRGQFGEGAEIGDTLHIRLPNDYTVSDGPSLSIQDPADYQFPWPVARGDVVRDLAAPIDKLALAVAAPVVVAKALEQPVTRRFWSNRSKSDDR